MVAQLQQFENVPSDLDMNDPAVHAQWSSMSEPERDQIRQDRSGQRARDFGIDAAWKGDWATAFKYANEAHDYAGQVWEAVGKQAPPEPVIKEALQQLGKNPSGLSDFLYSVAGNEKYRQPSHALSGDLVQQMTELAANPQNKGTPGVFRSTLERLFKHPNYDVGPHEAAQFWRNYEGHVDPAHFATVEHHLTGRPTTLTDHRGNSGSSSEYAAALPHLEKYAQRTQQALKGELGREVFNPMTGKSEPIIRKIGGKHFVKVHRGVAGDYADVIGKHAGLDDNGNVDRATLKVPTASLSSWSIDPQIAARFARRNINGQSRSGLIMSKWMPVDHLLHSGFHDVVPLQRHEHPDESELVFKHPQRNVKIPTSSLHVLREKPHSEDTIAAEHRILKQGAFRRGQMDWNQAIDLIANKRPFGTLPFEEESQLTSPHDAIRQTINSPEYKRALDDSTASQVGRNEDVIASRAHVPFMKLVRQHMKNAFPELDEEGNVKKEVLDKHLASVPKESVIEPVKVREPNQVQPSNTLRPVAMGKTEDWAPQLLEKMALADIPIGQQAGKDYGKEVIDYSHVLTPQHRAAGYRLHVISPTPPRTTLHSLLYHDSDLDNHIGSVTAYNSTTPGAMEPHSVLKEKHRGQGLGLKMYEALYAHARANGVKTIKGDYHSSDASRVHRALAARHGLDYQPQLHDATEFEGRGSYKPYEYTLKSEPQSKFEELVKAAGIEVRPLAKSEVPIDTESPIVAAMLGHNQRLDQAVEAARFLCRGQPHDPKLLRQKLWEADGDPERAALMHYGVEPSPKTLRALRGIKQHPFRKEEVMPHVAHDVKASLPEGEDTAESVRKAFAAGAVKEVKLGGKHSKGTLLAHDPRSNKVILLKPGSGPQSPAAGESEQPATQSECEVAFYQVVEAWGIGNFYPHADLLLIDGVQYAALKMLPTSYKTVNDLKAQHPGVSRHLFHPFMVNGILWKWAIADWVLGQVDRNDGNIMADIDRSSDGLQHQPNVSETEGVKLIDEGSTWAGIDFDPAHDRYSFTPGYLRAWYDGNFNQLTPQQKMQVLPRASAETEKMLRDWLTSLDPATMSTIARKYHVDPSAAEIRLANLKAAAVKLKVDLAVNQLWAVGANQTA